MFWFIYAFGAALIGGFSSILHRKIVLNESTISYAFLYNIIVGLMFIPFMLMDFGFSTNPYHWLIILASTILWSLVAKVSLDAYKAVEVSTREPISQINLIFVLILSLIFLKEILTLQKIIGTLIIFAGVLLITYEPGKSFRKLSEKGILLVILSAALYSIASIVDKYALNFFSVGSYGFMAYFLPGIVLGSFAIREKEKIKSLIKNQLKSILVVTFFGAIYFNLVLSAYNLTDISLAFPIIRLATFIAVFGGIYFLKEKQFAWKKVLAAIIVFIGVLLISGYYTII